MGEGRAGCMCVCVFPSLARTCHRKGQGRVPHLASILSATVFINRSHLSVCHLLLCCFDTHSIIITATHYTPPRASGLPLRERTWIAHSAPDGRLPTSLLGFGSGFERTCLLPPPLLLAARLLPLPGHFTRRGDLIAEEGLFGDPHDPAFWNKSRKRKRYQEPRTKTRNTPT